MMPEPTTAVSNMAVPRNSATIRRDKVAFIRLRPRRYSNTLKIGICRFAALV
jgi:hypothetical protein